MIKSAVRPLRKVCLRYRNPQYDSRVRMVTETVARSMGFDEDQVFDIALAVEEAYTNVIEHAARDGDIELEIIYSILEDRLEVAIHDNGCGFYSSGYEGKLLPLLSIESARGRGIALMRILSDEIEIISEPGIGTFIKLTKYLSKPAAGMRAPLKKRSASMKKIDLGERIS